MVGAMGIRKLIFGLNMKKVTFAALGFHIGDSHTHQRLENIVTVFASSYNMALDDGVPESVGARIERDIAQDLKGFAHEAAAMAFAVIDGFRLSRQRLFVSYAHEVCPGYAYLAYVGGGVACGAIMRNGRKLRAALDPFSNWLVLDGRGFYDAFFKTAATVRRHRRPGDLSAAELRQFDAGIGRGLWFIECGDPARIEATIAAFPGERQPAVWAGIGLACAYAGGVDRARLDDIASRAGANVTFVAQGVSLAAHARQRAQNNAPQVDLATEVFWGMSSLEVHQLAERCIAPSLKEDDAWPSFLGRMRDAYAQTRNAPISTTRSAVAASAPTAAQPTHPVAP